MLVLRAQSEQVIGFTKSLLNALEPRCPVVTQADPPTTQSKSTQTPSMKPTQTIAIQTTPPRTKTTSTQTDIPKSLLTKGTISLQTPPTPKPAKSMLPDIRHLLPTKPSWTTTQDQNCLQECFVKLHVEQCWFHNRDTPIGTLVPVQGSLAEATCKYDEYLTVMESLK